MCTVWQSTKKNATKAKPLSEATAKDVIPQVTWIWRFSWDHVQQKMTARKPFLSLGTDVKMTKGQCIKLTIWAARAIKEFSWGMEMETWESIIKWGTEDNTFLHITDLERLQWFIGGPCLRGILDFSMTGQGHQSQADAGWDSQAPWSWVKPTRQAQMSGMKEPDKPFLEARRIKKRLSVFGWNVGILLWFSCSACRSEPSSMVILPIHQNPTFESRLDSETF